MPDVAPVSPHIAMIPTAVFLSSLLLSGSLLALGQSSAPAAPPTNQSDLGQDRRDLRHDRRKSAANQMLDRRQRFVEIGHDVFHVLDPHRDPHHAIGDADLSSSLFAHGRVGHGRGMRDQRLHSAQRLRQ
jgi:hypothetical protein